MPSPSPQKVVPVAPGKIQQIREAGRRQLSPEEFQTLETLLGQLQVYGVTPYLNVELGKLVGKIEWELEISESPEWAEALIACDIAFLGTELKEMCDEMGVSSYGHKKELCRRLYYAKQPAVLEIMEPLLKGAKIPPPRFAPPAVAPPPAPVEEVKIVPAPAKEPWQMTQAGYVQRQIADIPGSDPDITRKQVMYGEGLDATVARKLADGTFQVTPSYNLVSKGFERKIFKTQDEAQAYISELQRKPVAPTGTAEE